MIPLYLALGWIIAAAIANRNDGRLWVNMAVVGLCWPFYGVVALAWVVEHRGHRRRMVDSWNERAG